MSGIPSCECNICKPIPGIIAKPPEVDGQLPGHEECCRYALCSECKKPRVNESARRKGMPLFQGCLMYFPDALLAVAEHSRKANDKHNPGEPLHWSKDKSKDHADCIARHLLDIGPAWDEEDPELGSLHATALAWRALALLQTVLERRRVKTQAIALDQQCKARDAV